MLRGPLITTVATRYFEENATTIKSTTRKKWMPILRRLQARYPQKRVNEISADDLRDFILRDDDGRPRKVSSSTTMSFRTCLRSFFSWCAFAGVIESDPSSVLSRTVRVKAQPVRSHVWMTEHEIGDLFDACRADPDELLGKRDAIAIGLGLFCGFRLHEIAKATWGDLNLRAGTISVLGKGGKLATLPIPPQLVEMLFEWQGLYAKGLGAPPARDQLILVTFKNQYGSSFGRARDTHPRWGVGVGPTGIYKMIRRRGEEIGIPTLAPHDLRRSYAGILEDRGVPLRDISSVLRHESIATTERYLADNPKKWQDSVSTAMAGIGVRSA